MRNRSLLSFLLILASLVLLSGCGSSSNNDDPAPTPTTADAYLGGLAFDNWTKAEAGGTGDLPTGVTSKDFVRCKACHGWDGKGLDGGYVRRSATDSRPNAELAGDLTTADADLSLAKVYNVGGRAFTTFDNTHPDYSVAEGLTEEQANNLVKYLTDGPKIGDYATIDATADPVAYTFTNADTAAGETLYASKCNICHLAANRKDTSGADKTALGDYFPKDGKYSEGFHKATYGILGKTMTRAAMGNPTGGEIADILAYVQKTQAVSFVTLEKPADVTYTASLGNVNFPHATHASLINCTECHVNNVTPVIDSKDAAHDLCRTCHADTATYPTAPDSNDCTTCHGN